MSLHKNILLILTRPPIPPLPLLLILEQIPREIHPSTRHSIRGTQSNGGAADDAPDAQLAAEALAAAQGKECVQAGPGGGEARAAGLVAGEVEVRGEEQRRGEEEQREGLHGAAVEGGDERCEESGGQGVCWDLISDLVSIPWCIVRVSMSKCPPSHTWDGDGKCGDLLPQA